MSADKEKEEREARGVDADIIPVSTRRDVIIKALRAAPVVLLLTARGAQAQGSAASGAPSGQG